MAHVRITCINKQPRNDPHEAITHVGGDGWRRTRQQVVESIRRGENTFFTIADGRRADVGIYKEVFLRTHADGYWSDNLLALYECVH